MRFGLFQGKWKVFAFRDLNLIVIVCLLLQPVGSRLSFTHNLNRSNFPHLREIRSVQSRHQSNRAAVNADQFSADYPVMLNQPETVQQDNNRQTENRKYGKKRKFQNDRSDVRKRRIKGEKLDAYSEAGDQSEDPYSSKGEADEEQPPPASKRNLKTKIHKLEEEIQSLEQGQDPKHNPIVRANLTYNLKWKHYKNLSNVDTMDLKYEVAGLREGRARIIIFYIVVPVLSGFLLIYMAITLFCTKCWFWKIVPPHRFYQFERFEADREDDPRYPDEYAINSPFIRSSREAIVSPRRENESAKTYSPRRNDTTDDDNTDNINTSPRKKKRGFWKPKNFVPVDSS